MPSPSQITRHFALMLALLCLTPCSWAQYPERLVKIIVPFSAGGFTDSLARTIAQELNKKWRQPVVVENKPGGGSNIGTDIAAKAAPDGYTLLLTGINHAINAGLTPNLPFDSAKDFIPVVLMVATPNVLIVNAALPVQSLNELINAVKADPKRFNYGSSGIGSSPHLQGELLKGVTGLQMTHVPYKGSSQALTDLLAGSVQLMFDNYMFQLPYIQSGKVKPLAITATQRSAALPAVPTMQELGIAGFERGPWFGFLAPAKTPMTIVRQINQDVNEILQDKEVRVKLAGAEIIGGTPEDFSAYMAKELIKWGALIRELNIKPE